MLPRYIRLLQATNSLGYLQLTRSQYNKYRGIIKTNSTNKINNMLSSLAYDLNISENGLNKIQLNNKQPLNYILYAYSECIYNKLTAFKYLCAKYLSTNIPDEVNFKNFRHKLRKLINMRKISIQQINKFANTTNIPAHEIKYTLKKINAHLYDEVTRYPIIKKHNSNQIRLNNYILVLTHMHGKTGGWNAKQINSKYSTMVYVIKHKSTSKILKLISPLNKIYPSLTKHTISIILKGSTKPLDSLCMKVLNKMHNRKDLLNFLAIYLILYKNLKLAKVCKACHFHTNKMTKSSYSQLRFMIRIISYTTQMNKQVTNKLLHKKCLEKLYVQLPETIHTILNYYNILTNIRNNKGIQAKVNSLKYQMDTILKQSNKYALVWNSLKEIIKHWGYIFNFDYHKFIKNNLTFYQHKIIYKQSHYTYPILTANNMDILLDGIYKQLTDIQKLKTLKNLNNYKYKSKIKIDGKSISQIDKEEAPIKHLMNGHRHIFVATFDHTDVKTISSQNKYHKEYYRPVIVLNDVKYQNKLILKHAVMNYTKIFINLHSLKHGDKLKFSAMVYPNGMTYNLNRAMKAKIIKKIYNHESYPVPTDIRALTWYSIQSNKSAGYDFTLWGKNYGYVRFCKMQYRLWKKHQELKGA